MINEYAKVVWGIDDILCLQPEWTRQQAEEWLEKHEKHIADRLTEVGWDVIDTLMSLD